MKSLFKLFVVSALALVWLMASSSAFAEPTSGDKNVSRLLRDDPTAGSIFIEVRFAELERPAPKICQSISVKLVSDAGVTTHLRTQSSPTFLGKELEYARYGAVAVLVAGVYTIQQVSCEESSGVVNLKGPFARFTLREGQVLNLGCLMVDYKLGPPSMFVASGFNGTWKAVDLSPRAVEYLNKTIPLAFAKAKKQYMTPIREAPKS
ncbi:MAG: hypothetical protein V4517_18050 [Pseudomonadota bacterium]